MNIKKILSRNAQELFPIFGFFAVFFDLALISSHTHKNNLTPTFVLTIILINLAAWFTFYNFVKKININYFKYAVPLLIFGLINIYFPDSIPRWDGSEYFQAMLRSIENFDFSLKALANFNWYKHMTMGYGFFGGIFQFLNPRNIATLNLFEFSLGAVAIISFQKIVDTVFNKNSTTDNVILTSIFAVSPLFLGVSSAFTPDMGVLAFFLAFLASYLNKKYILGCFFAILTIFSKETGAYAYGLFFILITLFYSIPEFIKHHKINFRNLFWLIFPFLITLIYFIYIKWDFWGPDGTGFYKIREGCRFCFGVKPYIVKEYLGVFLILNFNWVYFVFIVAREIKNILGIFTNSGIKKTLFEKMLWLFLLLYSGIFMIFVVYVMPRYIVLTLPVTILIFYYSINDLVKNLKTKKIVLVTILTATLIQSFVSIDPLSNKFFGTYQIGNYKILKIGTEYLGDSFIYNTQYLNIDKMLSIFIKQFNITENNSILIEPYTWGQYYPGWGHFSDKQPNILTSLDDMSKYPDSFYYLDFPFRHYTQYEPTKIENSYVAPLENKEDILKDLLSKYVISDKHLLQYLGYSVNVYKLSKK